LQSLEVNKPQFLGQPFSILMDSLKIQIKYFNQKTGIVYGIRKETSTFFGFFCHKQMIIFILRIRELKSFGKIILMPANLGVYIKLMVARGSLLLQHFMPMA